MRFPKSQPAEAGHECLPSVSTGQLKKICHFPVKLHCPAVAICLVFRPVLVAGRAALAVRELFSVVPVVVFWRYRNSTRFLI